MAAPTTVLFEALHDADAHDDFTRLSGDRKLLVLSAVVSYGRELLVTGNGAADEAGRLITAVTGCSRLGDAVRRAVRTWAGPVN